MFLHRKSNHLFGVWQHKIVLLTIRQYESKSFRMFVEWLVEEAYYLNISSIIPYSTLYHSSEICCKNKWYIIGEDNFLIHIITHKHRKNIYWNRFDRIQDN